MQKGLPWLLVSFFCAYMTISFILPFLSLNSLNYPHQYALFFASLIYATPYIAQSTTLHLFSWITDRWHREKLIMLLGYSTSIVQYLILYSMLIYGIPSPTAENTLLITFIANLFCIAYIPALKAYIARLSESEKGVMLGKLNIIQSAAFGIGSLAGGIMYDQVGLGIMMIISIILSCIAIGLLALVPALNVTQNPLETKNVLTISNILNSPVLEQKSTKSSVISFKWGLAYQFFIGLFAAAFHGIYAPFINHLGVGSWFFGLTNIGSAILGIITFSLFGRILDRYGSDNLYWYGWITYVLVYLALLTENLWIVFIVWMFPCYSFYIATEFLAGQQSNRDWAVRNMATATFAQQFSRVIGVILGGSITIWGDYRTVLWVNTCGTLVIGGIMIIQFLRAKQRKTKSK
jgi:MFS family permease